MAWSPPEHDYGAAVCAYHVDYSQVAARQRSAPSWHRAYCGADTCCEARPASMPGMWECVPSPHAQPHVITVKL